MILLFLDDNPARHQKATRHYLNDTVLHAYSVQQAIAAVRCHSPELLSLDHDLGDFAAENRQAGKLSYSDTVGDGTEFLDWLLANPPDPKPAVIVHSVNPEMGPKMRERLHLAGYEVRPNPIAWW